MTIQFITKDAKRMIRINEANHAGHNEHKFSVLLYAFSRKDLQVLLQFLKQEIVFCKYPLSGRVNDLIEVAAPRILMSVADGGGGRGLVKNQVLIEFTKVQDAQDRLNLTAEIKSTHEAIDEILDHFRNQPDPEEDA